MVSYGYAKISAKPLTEGVVRLNYFREGARLHTAFAGWLASLRAVGSGVPFRWEQTGWSILSRRL